MLPYRHRLKMSKGLGNTCRAAAGCGGRAAQQEGVWAGHVDLVLWAIVSSLQCTNVVESKNVVQSIASVGTGHNRVHVVAACCGCG
jgi:hypothetical protein